MFITTNNPHPCLEQALPEALLSCGLWINLDTYSSDVTQQKLPFRICVSGSFFNPNRVPASRTHMKSAAITTGGSKMSPSAFLSIPGPCTDRFVCYWRKGTQKKRLVRRRREVHDLKCTIDSRIICFSSLICVCACTHWCKCVFFIPSWWEQSLYIFCQLHFLAEAQRPVMKVSVTVWLNTLTFLPAVFPVVQLYYNNNFHWLKMSVTHHLEGNGHTPRREKSQCKHCSGFCTGQFILYVQQILTHFVSCLLC